ncbi:39363_t:CDS:1, partial [Gigaspora margarita]
IQSPRAPRAPTTKPYYTIHQGTNDEAERTIHQGINDEAERTIHQGTNNETS